MATDKVTLRFESTIETPNSEPLLLSGPIQLFGTVDEFNELFNNDMKSAINDESSAEFNKIIVFVSDVANVEAQSHRGAYFLYVGSRPVEKEELDISDWREILLGTHSHSNMAALESLQDLASDKDEIVVAKPDGTFSIIDPKKLVEINGGVPALPAEIQAKIDYLKKYSYLEEPTESSLHHLDAPLEELTNTYDWLEKDSDGNYRNMAVGSCRDLYRRLLKLDNKLYLKDDYTIGTVGKINGWAYLEAQAYEINFDDENVARKNEDTEKWIISVDLPWNILEQDKVLLFNDKNELIEDFKISYKGRKAEIQLDLNDEQFEGIKKITLLAIKDAEKIDLEILKNKFRNNELSLGDINEALVRLFVEGELNRKPNIPNLYLTTDEYGTIKWDNKLLPAQYFYSSSIIVNQEYLDDPENFDGELIKLVFKDAKYSRKNGDFALLLANEAFAFDLVMEEDSLDDAVYLVPRNSRYLDEDATTFTLVVIKRTSPESIADQVAENYISKKDAVDILSHGKINLKEYAKMTDLLELSKIGHTHSQYALKGHDHDYRYANFYHTHPEILKAVASIVGGDESVIKEKLEELSKEEQEAYKKLIESIFKNAGFTIETNSDGEITSAKITDKNIPLETETIKEINSILKASKNGQDLVLSEGSVLSDALRVIIEMFERDTVLTSQILLDSDIRVKLLNGPIGGIDSERTYYSGTPFETILKDILNPYKTVSDVIEYVRPISVTVSWYKYNSTGDIIEVDPFKLPYGNNGETLLFKYKLFNKFGKECQAVIIKNGKELVLQPKTILTNEKVIDEDTGIEYYVYDHNFDFTRLEESYPDIEFVFETMTIYDNYGMNPQEITFDKLVKTNILFWLEGVEYHIGTVSEIKDSYNVEDLDSLFGPNETGIFKLTDLDTKPYILIFLRFNVNPEDFKVMIDSDINIFPSFINMESDKTILFANFHYWGYYYEIKNKNIDSLRVKIVNETKRP